MPHRRQGRQDQGARELWEQIGYAAWACADPGIQYDTTINEWHTCPNSGRINASNPCSEYMFLDDTACNLASLNLMTFRAGRQLRGREAYEHAVRLWTVTLEISVLMAQFPSRQIAELSYRYRTSGLGYANLGGLLMASGLSYDSDRGPRHLRRHDRDHDRASPTPPRPRWRASWAPSPAMRTAPEMLRVIRNHRRAAHGETRGLRGPVGHCRCRSTAEACPDRPGRRGRARGPGTRR